MYNVSEAFKKAITNNARYIKAYITVKEKDYDIKTCTFDDNIYSADTDTFIGTFIAKSGTITLNKGDSLSLENESFFLYFGVILEDSTVEYVPMGKMNVYEKVSDTEYKFMDNKMYFNNFFDYTLITYPTTLLDFLQEVCRQAGVELATTDFPNKDLVITKSVYSYVPKMNEVIIAIAQASCTFARINREGKLELKWFKNTENVYKLDNQSSYPIVQKAYGPINSLVLNSKLEEESAEVRRQDSNSITANGLTEFTISDNPFLNMNKETSIEAVWNVLNGFSYIPYSADLQGQFHLDTGDIIKIQLEDGSYISFPVINHTLSYSGGIQSKLNAPAMTSNQISCIGQTGSTTYTWIKYADDVNGTNMNNDPENKSYIGIAYNKQNNVESDDPADYTWAKIKGDAGEDGISVQSCIAYFAVSTSNTIAPQTDSYIQRRPEVSEGQYLWQRLCFSYSDGSTEFTEAVCVTGESGDSAYSITLSNEFQGIAGDTTKAIPTTIETKIDGYYGSTKYITSIGTLAGVPNGMTATINNNNTANASITFNVTSSMTTKSGQISIPVTVGTATFTKYFGFTLNLKGADGSSGKSVSIVASSQLFKSMDNGKTFSPSNITLTPVIQGVAFNKWQYSANGGTSWIDVTSGQNGLSVSGNVLSLSVSSNLFSNTVTTLSFKCLTSDSNIYDVMTIARLYDVAEMTQEDVFNKLTNNGTLDGLYMENGDLYINADYIHSGTVKGERIDAKNLTVKKSDGTTTFKVDSDGNVTLNVASLSISGNGVATQNDLDNIQVGGRNLYVGTKDFSGNKWNNISSWTKSSETYLGFTVMSRIGAWGGLAQYISAKAGEYYTISFYAKVENGGKIISVHRNRNNNNDNGNGLSLIYGNCVVDNCEWTNNSVSGDITQWTYCWATLKVHEDCKLQWRIENSVSGKKLDICGFMMTRGNKNQDWSPAPEDLEAYSDSLWTQSKVIQTINNGGQGFFIENGRVYIGGEYIRANKLSAISSDLGDITGGSININNNFIVDGLGNMTAKTGYIGDSTNGWQITSDAITAMTDNSKIVAGQWLLNKYSFHSYNNGQYITQTIDSDEDYKYHYAMQCPDDAPSTRPNHQRSRSNFLFVRRISTADFNNGSIDKGESSNWNYLFYVNYKGNLYAQDVTVDDLKANNVRIKYGSGYQNITTLFSDALDSSGNIVGYLKKSGGTMTGNIVMGSKGKGYFLTDSSNKSYAALYDNGTNLWIGADQSSGTHHTGGTYISAGSGSLNVSRLVSGTRTNYLILDAGNYSGYALPLSGGTVSGQVVFSGGNGVAVATANTGRVLIGDPTGEHLAIDGNEIMAKKSGTAATTLNLNAAGGAVDTGGVLRVKGAEIYLGHDNIYQINTGTSKLNNLQLIDTLFVNSRSSGTDGGIGLYGTSEPTTYGIAMRLTSSLGTHGYVTGGDWATYFSMNNQDNRGWIFRRGEAGGVASIDTSGRMWLNGNLITSGVGKANNYIAYPSDGVCNFTNSSYTGYLKITLPQSWTNTMLRFKVSIFDYRDNGSVEYLVGGYNYTGNNGSWVNCFSQAIAKHGYYLSNLTVRFGHDGTKCAIYIGESSTTWSFPKVSISDITLGHQNFSQDKWMTGWAIDFTTTLGTISLTQTNTNIAYTSHQSDMATGDALGQNIGNTYLKTLRGSGNGASFSVIGVNGSGTDKITVQIPNASTSAAGLITTGAQTLTGIKTLDTNGGLTINGVSKFHYAGIEAGGSSGARPIWFSYLGRNGTPVYNDAFTYEPVTRALSVGKIDLNRSNGINFGRISWYSPSYHTWVDYMSRTDNGSAPTGGKPSSLGNVTSWAIRSLIQHDSGCGWIWESCSEGAAADATTTPTPRMALSSANGQLTLNGHFVFNSISNQIQRGGNGVSWYQGRLGAILRQTTYTGYNPILSMKTADGDWALGVYTGNIAYMTYITDSNYNSNNNITTAQMRFYPDGAFQSPFIGVNGKNNGYNLYVNGSSYLAGSTTITGATTLNSTLGVNGATTHANNVGSNNYASGYLGHGWRTDSAGNATFETLQVRGEIRAAKWQIDNIVSMGGNFYITPTWYSNGKGTLGVGSYSYGSDTYTCSLTISDTSTPSTVAGVTWSAGCKVKIQGTIGNYDLGATNGVIASVNAKVSMVIYFNHPTLASGSAALTALSNVTLNKFAVMFYAKADGTHQGIYMTAADSNSPFIDIYDGALMPKVRLGRLDGISDGELDSNPTGYGLYSQNVFLKGKIVAKSGKIGGWTINQNWLGNGTMGQSGGVFLVPSAGITANICGISSNGWVITAGANFGVTSSGGVYAISGKIGGFNLTSNALYTNSNSYGAANNIYIGNGGISLGSTFRVNSAGYLTTTSGTIGKFTITDKYLYTGSGATQAGIGANQAFWAGSGDSNTAPFRVSYGGELVSTSGSIGGWTISGDSLSATVNTTFSHLSDIYPKDAGQSNSGAYRGTALINIGGNTGITIEEVKSSGNEQMLYIGANGVVSFKKINSSYSFTSGEKSYYDEIAIMNGKIDMLRMNTTDSEYYSLSLYNGTLSASYKKRTASGITRWEGVTTSLIGLSSSKNVYINGDKVNNTNIYAGTSINLIAGNEAGRVNVYKSGTAFSTSNTGVLLGVYNKSSASGDSTNDKNFIFAVGVDGTSQYIRSYATYTRTYSNAANVYITSSGTFGRSTSSSIRYKHDINYFTNKEYATELGLSKLSSEISYENYRKDMRSVLDIPVVYFRYNQGYVNGEPNYDYSQYVNGFIAEDVYKISPDCAILNKDGTVETWNERTMIPKMLYVEQEHDLSIQNHEQRIKQLEEENDLLKKQKQEMATEFTKEIQFLSDKLNAYINNTIEVKQVTREAQ